MSTMTLTLYKDTKLDDSKNFVVDDIETYLASKTSKTITKFQYQKLHLNATIKIDQNQSYLIKGSALNRYDYCKISVEKNNTTINYYYFILRASWKAEETIAFEIKMDTLNSYKFSNVEADDSYTLSNKTLVTREHKDRLKQLQSIERYKAEETTDAQKTNIAFWKSLSAFIGSFRIKFDFNALYDRWIDNPNLLLSFPVTLTIGSQSTSFILLNDKNEVLDSGVVSSIEFNPLALTIHTYEDIHLSYVANRNNTLLISVSSALLDTPPSVDKNDEWDFVKQYFLDTYNYVVHFVSRYERIVDQYQEGIDSITFKTDESTLYDDDGSNAWYVVYSSANTILNTASVSEVKYVNPVHIQFYSDVGYKIVTSTSAIRRYYAKNVPQYADEREFIMINPDQMSNDSYFEIEGVRYDKAMLVAFRTNHPEGRYCIEKTNNKDSTFSAFGYCYRTGIEGFFLIVWYNKFNTNPFEYIDFYNIPEVSLWKGQGVGFSSKVSTIKIGVGSNSQTLTCDSFNELDLTDPQMVKVINFPYVPMESLCGIQELSYVPNEFVISSGNDCLEMKKPQRDGFTRVINFGEQKVFQELFIEDVTIGASQSRNILYESKLFHSDFRQAKFVYDSFSFTFRYEDVDIDKYNENQINYEFNVEYVCSSNVQSKFMFKFTDYLCKREALDYNNILIVERNNEKALYNNAYIDYIKRGGFNNDTKNANAQKMTNGVTTALSAIGSIASFVGAWASGNPMLGVAGVTLATGTIASISRNISSARENDRAIAQKILSATQQATSVSTSEDLDILKAYSGNKAKLCYYELSSQMKQAMWDLFHYCGYATHEQKVPDVTTRLYFNFVQADIVFSEYSFDEDIADDIKNKWKQGVTFIHKVSGAYDIEQQYENFEVSLI